MCSKFLCPTYRLLSQNIKSLLLQKPRDLGLKVETRKLSQIPKSQFDMKSLLLEKSKNLGLRVETRKLSQIPKSQFDIKSLLLEKPKNLGLQMETRKLSLIPKSQYDVPIPKRLHLSYAMRVYWEIIPLILVTAFGLTCMFGSIAWAVRNKVDVVFTSHSRENISHTMNLREPTCHKLITINQKYEPWPEMAEVKEKMAEVERKMKSEDYCPP